MKIWRQTTMVLAMVAGISAAGCGSNEFSGNTGTQSSSDQNPVPTPDSLQWLWGCDAGQEAQATADANENTIEGIGPHTLSRFKFGGKPVTVSGKLCAPPKTKRDIIFVIDVSGSMTGGLLFAGADPLRSNSCGRLAAIHDVMELAAKNGDTRFGVVTFSSAKVAASSTMFANESDLFTDLIAGSGKSHISQIICAGSGDTNYDEGLRGGWDLLKATKRAEAVQEIYFISDGVPDPAQYDGIAMSREIRKAASVATVMLGSANDVVMREYIASRDAANKPYHAHAANSSQLAKVLAKLASNDIQGGTLQYRAAGEAAWTDIDLTPHIGNGQFKAPSFKIDPAAAPDGLELHFSYWDRFGHTFENSGTIVWKEDYHE